MRLRSGALTGIAGIYETLHPKTRTFVNTDVVYNIYLMKNPYKFFLDDYFDKLSGFRHSTNRVNKVLTKDVEIYLPDGARFYSGSSLVISDWTSPTDNGWEINFHTGIFKETVKEGYPAEVKRIISRECCLMYAQSFEALESLLKDLIFHKACISTDLEQFVLSKKKKESSLTRDSIPGGCNLFDIFKKFGGRTYKTFSEANNENFRFKELWKILSETRHAITHSQSILKASELKSTDYHFAIFKSLFDYENKEEDKIEIQLDSNKFEKLIKKLSEFGFQAFKIACIEDGLDWSVYK